MIGGLFGNFIGGVLWGVGASVAGRMLAGGGEDNSLRDFTKGAVKAYLAASERAEELIEEARTGFEVIVAEVERERQGGSNTEVGQ